MSRDDAADLLARVRSGDGDALATVFSAHRDRLRRMVQFRMDSRLRGRVDADDILQEAYLDAAQRADSLRGDQEQSGFIWLRLIVGQTMINVHRRHLGAKMRDAGREAHRSAVHGSNSAAGSIIANLLGRLTSPTEAARRLEFQHQLEQGLAAMDPLDREVLALRHFEELSNAEVALELEMQPKAASMRYVRALKRLKDILADVPGFSETYGDGPLP